MGLTGESTSHDTTLLPGRRSCVSRSNSHFSETLNRRPKTIIWTVFDLINERNIPYFMEKI